MFVDNAFFVKVGVFLCANKESPVRFTNVIRVTTKATEFVNNVFCVLLLVLVKKQTFVAFSQSYSYTKARSNSAVKIFEAYA